MQRGRFVWDGSHCDRKEFSCKTQCAECIMTDKPVQNLPFYILHLLAAFARRALKKGRSRQGFFGEFCDLAKARKFFAARHQRGRPADAVALAQVCVLFRQHFGVGDALLL